MEKAHDGSPAKWQHRRPWQLLVLILLFAAGYMYLDRQGVDWRQNVAALREWYSEKPPAKEVRKPVPPSELLPSFDLANADETGRLVAAGRGEAGWIIRLGSDTQTLGETKADDNNEWVLIPEEPLAPGDHVLSLLEIEPVSKRSISGKRSITLSIAPRKEIARQPNKGTPVQEVTASAPNAQQERCAVAIVKPGDTLWHMAQHCYGDGAQYSKIFESNRQQIQNPNLIYTDQKLALPH
jgi:hypothetical protein